LPSPLAHTRTEARRHTVRRVGREVRAMVGVGVVGWLKRGRGGGEERKWGGEQEEGV
jgi:hypothetical protein